MPYPKSSAVSIGILGILVLIAGWVFNQQFKFNPAVKVLSESTFSGGPAIQPPLAAGDSGPLVRLTDPLSPLSPPEHFNSVTLSDKIDGKAELYLPSGFISMDCQRFKALNSDIWLEVFIYDMGLPENAFSVFSRQKRENITSLDLAPYAYQTENAIFLAHGRYYIEMIASDPSSLALGWMTELARAFISDHPALSPKKMAIPDLFPTGPANTGSGSQEGAEPGLPRLDRESITLVTTDAFGFDQFDQVYTAGYRVNGTEVSAYISQRESPREAETLALAYTDFLEKFGGTPMETAPMDQAGKDRVTLHAVTIMDTVEMVFSVGPFLAGVREATDPKTAQALARALILSLEKQGSDPP